MSEFVQTWAFLDDEQSALLAMLRDNGPQTVRQLVDRMYPTGDGFAEDWDLAAPEKVEMELGRIARQLPRHAGAVKVVAMGAGEDPDYPDGLVEVWGYQPPSLWARLEVSRRRRSCARGAERVQP